MKREEVQHYIRDHGLDAMRLAGERIGSDRQQRQGSHRVIEVFDPFCGERLGTVPKASLEELRQAYRIANAAKHRLSRFDRAAILNKAADLVRARRAA
ncbi:MAG: aldehyde dehydrogenase family protein, partial [Betaproteobacteria bacterium]|nr:aldehyde dehydrogenase family protein [Betaproteobacteria bacterium]